jgi:small-conductance mechanosensitive channel
VTATLAWTPGWFVEAGVALVLVLLGAWTLRSLARARVAWWPSVAPLLLTIGPAAVLVLGGWAQGGPLLFAPDSEHWRANLGWSLFVFCGATAVLGVVRAFLLSRTVQHELGVRIPSLLLDALRILLWVVLLFVVVGGIWGKTEWFSALFTASAIGTLVLGLALQDTLQNFFAGVGIIAEHSFAIGEWIWVGEHEGEVVSISRRATRIRTRAGDIVTIPNRVVATSAVRNTSQPTPLHAELLVVPAPYDAPPNRVRDLLRAALRDAPGVQARPEPRLRLLRYAESGIEYQVKFWLDDIARLDDIRSDALVQIWYHFARAGISFPYPVREVRRLPPPAARGIPLPAVRARLGAAPLFRDLPEDLLEDLAHAAEALSFSSGERVVVEGESGDSCYVVDRGTLEVLVGGDSHRRRVATLASGDLFGEMSLLTGEPRTATVRALEDALLVRVGAEALRGALQRSPDLAQRIAEAVSRRREGLAQARRAAGDQVGGPSAEPVTSLAGLIRKFFRLGESEGP